MRTFLIFLVSAFVIFFVYPDDSHLTQGQYNGRFWESLNEPQKSLFVTGIETGINAAAAAATRWGRACALGGDKVSEEISEMISSVLTTMYLQEFTNNEIVTLINEIYSNPYNRSIPIGDVYGLICKPYQETASEIEYYLKHLRKFYE